MKAYEYTLANLPVTPPDEILPLLNPGKVSGGLGSCITFKYLFPETDRTGKKRANLVKRSGIEGVLEILYDAKKMKLLKEPSRKYFSSRGVQSTSRTEYIIVYFHKDDEEDEGRFWPVLTIEPGSQWRKAVPWLKEVIQAELRLKRRFPCTTMLDLGYHGGEPPWMPPNPSSPRSKLSRKSLRRS